MALYAEKALRLLNHDTSLQGGGSLIHDHHFICGGFPLTRDRAENRQNLTALQQAYV